MKLNSIAFGQAAGLSYLLLLFLSVLFSGVVIVNYGSVLMHTACYFFVGYVFSEFYNSRLKKK